MYIDRLITVWERIRFSSDCKKGEILEMLKNGNVNSLYDEDLGFIEEEELFETAEGIHPEGNNGESTLGFYDDEGNPIWENCSKIEKK